MLVLFLAAALLSQAPEPALDCDNVMTTLDVNACMAKALEAEEARMNAYLEAAIGVLREEAETPEQANAMAAELQASQKLWADYAESACQAVYSRWQAGTIRVSMALSCKQDLTLERTHALWVNYLAYMDSTPPRLPEPVAAASRDEPVKADD